MEYSHSWDEGKRMKKTRILILGAVITVALVAAVVPALAAGPNASFPNWSFEFDTDGNGVPNAWKMTGENAIYVCGHGNAHAFDDCVVGFLPNDDGRALIWQTLDRDFIGGTDEGYPTSFMTILAAANNLDSNRVYGGWIACWDDLDYCIRYYGAVRGGSYNFNLQYLWDSTQNAEKPGLFLSIGGNQFDRIVWGFMALPGAGQLYIDFAQPQWVVYVP